MSVVTEEMKGRAAEAIGDAFGGSCMRQAGSCYDDPEFCGCQRAAAAALAAVAPLIAKAERDRLIGVSPRDICWENGDPIATKINPDATPDDYRDALMGIGPMAAEWQDKPHRLLYDLAAEVKRLQAELASIRALGDAT